MAASAPISEVLVVMPSVTMSWVPMIAPTTHKGAMSATLPTLKKAG